MKNRPLKIAFLSQYFYPEQFSNNDIAAHLVAQGHEVNVVCCVPNYPSGVFFDGYSNAGKRVETWQGVRVFRARTVARGQGAVGILLNYLTYPFMAIWALIFHVRARHDVSFVSMPSPVFQAIPGIWLKWVHGVPLVYWVQDIWPESALVTLDIKNRLVSSVLRSLCGWLYRRADLVLVQSEAFPELIARFGVPRERIKVLPNTAPVAEPDTIPEDPMSRFPKLPEDACVLLFAGNIGTSQDFETLISAADKLRDIENLHWVIVGSGRAQSDAQKLVDQKGLSDVFRFAGRFSPAYMPMFYARADALLVSLKDSPIFRLTVPYKVQGYMAAGRPIIASLSGEGARIIENAKAGMVAPASQPDELAQEIRRFMYLEADERQALGANGKAYFRRHFSPEVVYPALEKWLQETATRNP